MPKLTEREREGFEKILSKDLAAIDQRFISQIKEFWEIARNHVLHKKGWDTLIKEKEKLEIERTAIAQRIHEIEHTLKSEDLRVEQLVELGGKPDSYGHVRGATFYGIPIESQFDYEIVEYIKQNIDLEVPAKILRNVCESSIRALTMAGTFEEARAAYEKFYSLDFRKFGVDIPPRLEDICANKNSMLYAQQSLQQIEKGKPDIKLIESSPEGDKE